MCRYDEALKKKIWERGRIIEGYDKNKCRQDACGAWILWDHYGDRESPFGWEVDHIYPESKLREKGVDNEMIDNPVNLRPLNWKNNDSKGADYPSYQASMKSENQTNVEGAYQFTINEEVRNELEQYFREYL